MFMDPDKCDVKRYTRKNEAGRYPAILAEQTWSIKHSLLIYPKREPFLSEPTTRWARLAHSDNQHAVRTKGSLHLGLSRIQPYNKRAVIESRGGGVGDFPQLL